MRSPEGILCFVSLDVPELTRRSVLDLAAARKDIDSVNRLIHDQIAAGKGELLHELDPESGCVVVFSFVEEALNCGIEIQLAATSAGFPCRIGVTTRQVHLVDDQLPPELDDRLVSIRQSAHCGQIVFDLPTKELAPPRNGGQHVFIPLGMRIVEDREGRERLFQLHCTGLTREFPEPPGVVPAFRLPSSLTAFVGRWGEIERVLERFYISRAVTICGPAGLGKTRTAVQVAHELVERQPDGVWFVDLSLIKSGPLVADSIVRSLPKYSPDDLPALESLIGMLADKELLLVLDNAEHVLLDAAKVVDALSRTCPNIQFLCTSREPLGIEGESVVRLGPLEIPSPAASPEDVVRSDSMALLLDRMRIQNPDFEPNDVEIEVLAEACREVDGIPLALELVASRMQQMSPTALLKSLRSLKRLNATWRTTPDRHVSLQRALEWGYGNLSAEEKQLFHRLSVFAGGATLEAVNKVCVDDTLPQSFIEPAISELVRCSLLIEERGRFRMLLPMREFAQDKLRDLEGVTAVRDRHLEWMIELVSSAPAFPETDAAWIDKMEPEMGNAREALEWARAYPCDDRAFRLAYGLYDFWFPKAMMNEGSSEIRKVLGSSRRLHWLSRVKLCNAKAILDMERGEFEAALSDYNTAARLAKKHGDELTEARILANVAIVLRRLGRSREAFERGAELLRRMPETDPMWAGQQINVIGAALDVGEYEDAQSRIEAVERFAQTHGSRLFAAMAAVARGNLGIGRGRFDEAQDYLERAYVQFWALADLRSVGISLSRLIVAVEGAGLYRQAAAYHGCLMKLRESVSLRLARKYQVDLDRSLIRLRKELGDAAFEMEVASGRRLEPADLDRHLRDRLGELDGGER